jgi:hypothetical protein
MSEGNAVPDSFYSAITERLPPEVKSSASKSASKTTVPFEAEAGKPNLSRTLSRLAFSLRRAMTLLRQMF